MNKMMFKKTYKQVRSILLLFSLMLLFNLSNIYAQNNKIVKGTVTNSKGEALPVVSVVLKGTSTGSLTDDNGNYSITIPSQINNPTLIFSFIGFQEKEEVVGARTTVNITMQEEASQLSEVVVVGYATQKKQNLTGAVAQVSGNVLESRPISNLGQGLQGVIPNLQITPNGNAPGQGTAFNIRGYTSLNGGGPLILVDNVVQDPNLINPEDIASVSILKDAASASIYGARAAYGVVLITTKKGKREQTPTINFSGLYAFNKPTYTPKYANSWEYVNYMDLASINNGGSGYFDARVKDAVWKYYADPANNLPVLYDPNIEKDGKYVYVGNTDWAKELYTTGTLQQYNANLSGGSEKSQYYISYGFLGQKGVLASYDDRYTRHNFNADLNVDVTKWLTIGSKVKYAYSIENHPSGGSNGSSRISEYTGQLKSDLRPLIPIKHPDGNWAGQGDFTNPFAVGAEGGYDKRKINDLWLSGNILIRPIKDLNLNADFTFNPYSFNKERTSRQFKEYHADGTYNLYPWSNPNSVTLENSNDYYTAFNAFADYSKSFKKHNFKVLVGYNQEIKTVKFFSSKRENLIDNNLPAINLATGTQTVNGNAGSWSVQGVFARLNYNYDEKYLLEINGRYDGSSKFPAGDRFAFFPSYSAAWRIIKEGFMDDVRSVLSELKLRGSYGSLGNQNVASNFPYIPNYSVTPSQGYIFGNATEVAIAAPGLVSSSFTWEKVRQWNVGVDYAFWNNKLSGSFDYYQRYTLGMLTSGQPLPGTLGAPVPQENAADLRTAGWELSLSWRDNIGEFNYGATLSLSDSQAEITRFDNPTGTLSSYYKGRKLGEIWGYEATGLFQSYDEIAAHTSQAKLYGGTWNPGDVKYVDKDDNNEISSGDNTIYNPGDRSIIGNTTARYEYGLMLNATWKGFDVDIFFQGVGKRDFVPDDRFWGINDEWDVPMKDALNYWTKETPNAYLPRPYINGGHGNRYNSTFYLQNAAYLRLKQLSIGYTLPKTLTDKMGINRLRIYFTGQNLVTWTSLSKIYDPEIMGTSVIGTMTYPISKYFSFGLNLTL